MNTLMPQTHLRGDYVQICERLRQVRVQVCGRRGQSRFAFLLGLSPSTYNYYEKRRIPPVEVMDLTAKITGVPLMWLIRGEPDTFQVSSLVYIVGELPEKPAKNTGTAGS